MTIPVPDRCTQGPRSASSQRRPWPPRHNGNGQPLGTVTRNLNVDSGALLVAARMAPGFSSIVITDQAEDDIAIRQLRVTNTTKLR